MAEEPIVVYRATVNPLGFHSEPYFHKLKVVKKTPDGFWILDETGKRRWTNGTYASRTKEEALERLKHRTRAYVRHAFLKYWDALERAKALGIKVPVHHSPDNVQETLERNTHPVQETDSAEIPF